jgi:CHASE3 domain sensor protein
MTLRLTNEEQAALRAVAEAEGISMQDAVRQPIRQCVVQSEHRDRVEVATSLIITRHADALRRLSG